MQGFGLAQSDFKIRLSDRHMWVLFLEHWGVGDSDLASVLSVMDRMHRMNETQLHASLLPYFKDFLLRKICFVVDLSNNISFCQIVGHFKLILLVQY